MMLFSGMVSKGQWGSVYDGLPGDSVVFDFAAGDSLRRSNTIGEWIIIDTSGCTLWQIGKTNKPGFLQQSNTVRGIMTDTQNAYSIHQDESFIFKGFNSGYNLNPILSFEHRYQTRAGKDGGLVELSADGGNSWGNIFQYQGNGHILTDSFYTASDTISGGFPAFSGSSNGYIRSRIQLFIGFPLRPASLSGNPLWLRFRFRSDSTADTLAGWNIRRIVLENDQYLGVENTLQTTARLSFSPNPSAGLFRLDDAFEITPDQRYEVRNTLGAVLISGKPERTFDLRGLPKGLYFIRILGKDGAAGRKVTVE